MRRANTRGTQGYVLVNALILVAALSALSLYLLSRSEAGYARLQSGKEGAQILLNLDAFDAYAQTLLLRDQTGIDHLTDPWAQPLPPVDLARGQVTGQIADMQGRFNVNWMAVPDSSAAQRAFDHLVDALDLPPETGQAIKDYVQLGSGANAGDWTKKGIQRTPVGGPLLLVEQLRDIPTLSDQSFAQLRPYITALPDTAPLNVNTAPQHVLSAFFPHLSPSALATLSASRQAQPFATVDAFLEALERAEPENVESGEERSEPLLNAEQISVFSDWFVATAQTRLGPLSASGETVMRRKNGVITLWRRTSRP